MSNRFFLFFYRFLKKFLDLCDLRKPKYHRIEDLIDMIDEPNRTACLRILSENRTLFLSVQGSTHNHQAWRGGYFDHTLEIMNIALLLYRSLARVRELPFSLSDILLTTFLHDIEKPWKYELDEDGQLRHRPGMQSKADHQRFRMEKLAHYGVVLTPEQENGIKYAEGEINDYSNKRRTMGELAALTHMCDVASARLYFDHPLPEHDTWVGAQRTSA